MNVIQILTIAGVIVGIAAGIGGLLLGFSNRRFQSKYAASRLRVIPKLAFPGPSDEMIDETYYDDRVQSGLDRLKSYACIEVTNIGPNAQIVYEVGFINSSGQRLPWRNPDWIEPKQSYPLEIAPDESVSVYLRVFPGTPGFIHGVAFAKTDCGDEFNGTSPIMTDVLSQYKAVSI